MTKKTNRADADLLGDIRAQIKALEQDEAEVRDRILKAGVEKIIGEDFVATVKATERRSLDSKAVLSWYGEQELARFMRNTERVVVSTKPRREA